MAWLNNEVPNVWQWIGLFATILGMGMAFWAALSARSAKQQAQEAKEAAIRIGHVLQLSDLLLDMQELQTMLAREDYEAIGAKTSTLRGRIVRFKRESYNSLGDDVAEQLDRARSHLKKITQAATNSKLKKQTRTERIQVAFAEVTEALNFVAAIQQRSLHGE